ncbi:carbonic anhydrase 2 [Leptinotarsa decemlineata]|uniref:carbonic anhydrase 2 n=1 Tax=Leptinotarsa decemlineata TaxID=7539 RepID=UPI000C2523F5|nr:carbonic anhydrase 2-like [Leptinotarsa decemlineata]
MDWLASLLPSDFGSHYYFFAVAVIVLGGLYLNDLCNGENTIQGDANLIFYGYSAHDGPAVWMRHFATAAEGKAQSPINLKEKYAVVVPTETSPPLVFSADFHAAPAEMKIYNNSHNVVVYAAWPSGRSPSLVGGPLAEDYSFVNARFRWGPNDHEGSEHMVNSTRFAMELQAAFVKTSFGSEDILEAASSGALLMLSYLFMVTPLDNPYLEPIIGSLKYLRYPMSCICIEPVILSLLMPDFSREYYSYSGSLTFPPCTEGVTWIVKPEPLMISSRQIKQFRKLHGCRGRIETNTRPVQKIEDRDVFYYD